MQRTNFCAFQSPSSISLASSNDQDFLSQSSSSENSSGDRPFNKRRKRGKKNLPLSYLKTDVNAHPPRSGSLSPNSVLRHFCSPSHPPSAPWISPPTNVSTPQPIATPPVSESPTTSPVSRWDELEVRARDIKESGYPHTFTEAGRQLFLLLDSDILATRRPYRRFLQYTGQKAQILVNALQWILQFHPSLEGPQRRKLLKALLRLTQRNRMLPEVYRIRDVGIGEVAYQSSGVDVYRGTHRGRVVCLKKYRSFNEVTQGETTEMWIKEAVLWFNHRHPGIIPFEGILQVGPSPNSTYLVSPFLEHGTVPDFLNLHPHVDRRLLVHDVLSAIAFLHESHVVHGDIKGCNVLVNQSGRAVLADLGLSRLSDNDVVTWTSIQTTSLSAGTLPFLAPELLRAHQTIMTPSTASDVYALGCLTYEVFTGLNPFGEIIRGLRYGAAAHQMATHVGMNGKHPWKPPFGSASYLKFGLTEDIWSMMESCWNFEARTRPTANQLLQQWPFLTKLVDIRPSILED